jgi:hypothetical protein
MTNSILLNGKVATMNPTQSEASALAICEGKIAAVGDDDAIFALALPSAKIVNLGGRRVIPGLLDAHVHLSSIGWDSQIVSLYDLSDKAEAVRRVAERAAQTPPDTWIIGRGWAQDDWPDRAFPTAADLDSAAPEAPVYLTARSGHAVWVNSAALKIAGVTAETPDPPGGTIVRDANGTPTGILLEDAAALVGEHVPSKTVEERAAMITAAQEMLWKSGLVGVRSFDGTSAFRAAQTLAERGELGIRVAHAFHPPELPHAAELGVRSGFGGAWLWLSHLKIFADGALGPRTAWMLEPYEGEPANTGIPTIERDELCQLVLEASRAGIASAVHAIGDRAVRTVIDVFEAAREDEKARGIPPDALRHCIEHVQIIDPADVRRMAALNIIASMQPVHATSDYKMSDLYWGARSANAYNPRIQIDAGTPVAFGSDSPVEPYAPLLGIHAAITRRRTDGSPGPEGWYPQNRVTLEEALAGFTVGAAYAMGIEGVQGRIAPGFNADIVVLGEDIFTAEPDAIPELPIAGTMTGGIWRYRTFD